MYIYVFAFTFNLLMLILTLKSPAHLAQHILSIKEFYHKFFHLLKDELTELYNNIKFEKIMPDSHKNATVKLLFKKGDHRSLKNWRPISLLNTDYKILSKILTNHRIFISNISNLRSSQLLPFIFFDLRAFANL